ncbi:iron ABC transporter permease [Neisseriaceae bacterium ESL0693]|nr:iron ABC transporter permease [Neisseriaceae bacterium ESL0693]
MNRIQIKFSRMMPVMLGILPLAFLVAMVLLPLFQVMQYTHVTTFGQVWQDEYMRRLLSWTLWQALVSAFLVALLGVPVGWVLAHIEFRGRKWLLRLLILPFVMPTLVAAVGVLGLFGEQGWLWRGWNDTPYLLFYGNVFFNLPVLVQAVYQGLCRVPATQMQMAQAFGATAWQRFWQVEWRVLCPWLIGGVCLVFLYCFSGFGLALLLGGARYGTLEVQIYQLIALELDMDQASVLVLWALAVTLMAGLTYAVLSKWTAQEVVVMPLWPQPPQQRWQKGALAVALLILLVCCALPLVTVWGRLLLAGASWRVMAETETWQAIGNMLRFSSMAVLLAMILGVSHAVLAHYVNWIRGLTFLPFMVSPVCISFGLLLCYPAWMASMSMLVCTYALLAYPFVTKDVLAALDGLPKSYVAAARTLGATRWQSVKTVVVPLLRPALQRGLALAAATCVGEFAATLFLSRPEWQTLTTLIYHYLNIPGSDNYDRAMVLTGVLMILATLIFMLLEWQTSARRKGQ